MGKKKEVTEDDDLDDLLEQQWEKQDQIHHKCKMREKMKNSELEKDREIIKRFMEKHGEEWRKLGEE